MNLLDPKVIQTLANAGGWVVAVILLATGIALGGRAVAGGKIVAGSLLDRSIGLQEAIVPAINGLVAGMKDQTTLIQSLVGQVRDQGSTIRELAQQLAEARKDIERLEIQQRGGGRR